jgi:predicted enzyme related to lactoylglutathione lyase
MPAPTYANGIPCWVDLATSDIADAQRFYGGLFGWEVQESENPEETGGYCQALIGGKRVAGMAPLMQPEQPVAWSTYFWTDDLDATAAKVGEAGGQTAVPAMDVMALGRMAFFIDPTGAFFGCWQPGEHRGAEVANDPGTFTWSELHTRDMDAARAFYGAALGLATEVREMGPVSYTEFRVGDRMIAGGLDQNAQGVPEGVPPYWLVYFGAADVDAALGQVKELGGSVMVEPMDVPAGRFAIVVDPQGAAFGIFQPAS